MSGGGGPRVQVTVRTPPLRHARYCLAALIAMQCDVQGAVRVAS